MMALGRRPHGVPPQPQHFERPADPHLCLKEPALPRSKIASRQEAEEAVRNALTGLREALMAPKAPKVLERWLNQIAREWWFWHQLVELRRKLPRGKFIQILTPDAGHIARECETLKVTQADLRVFSQTVDMVATAISKGQVPPASPAYMYRLSRFCSRQAYAAILRPRKLKPIYLKAYDRRAQSKIEGRMLTAAALAQELTPEDYQRSPENATRNMQRGLKRVEREHRRCKSLSIPFPVIF
jgi:hypothetical protein